MILVAGGLLVYGGSTSNAFHYDDEHSIVNNAAVRSLANLPSFFTDPTTFSEDPGKAMYRPLLVSSYALNYALDDYRLFGFHLVNLALHIGNAFLLFHLGALLFDGRSAACAAVLFLAHPIASEPVNYISARSESLAALFYLACIARYIKGSARGSAFFFVLGLLSKSTAVTAPVTLLCYELGRECTWRGLLAALSRLRWHLAAAALYAAFLRDLVGAAIGDNRVRGLGEQMLTQFKALVYYAKLLIFPSGLSVEHAFYVSTAVEPVHVVIALFLPRSPSFWRAPIRPPTSESRCFSSPRSWRPCPPR